MKIQFALKSTVHQCYRGWILFSRTTCSNSANVTFNILLFFLKIIEGTQTQKRLEEQKFEETQKFHISVVKRGRWFWKMKSHADLTGQRYVSIISQQHLARLLNQNYPRLPCEHAEKLTGTTLRAQSLHIKKILHITNTMEKMILLYTGEFCGGLHTKYQSKHCTCTCIYNVQSYVTHQN